MYLCGHLATGWAGLPGQPSTALLFAVGPTDRQQIKPRSGEVYVTQEKDGEALQELACLSVFLTHFITETSRRPHLVFLYPICKPVTLTLRGVWLLVHQFFFSPLEDVKGSSGVCQLCSQTEIPTLLPNPSPASVSQPREQNVLVSSSIISF